MANRVNPSSSVMASGQQSDTAESTPQPLLCTLCLGEQCSEGVGTRNSNMIRSTVKKLLGLELSVTNWCVCTPCWNLVQLMQAFRMCCLRASGLLKFVEGGLKSDESWSSDVNVRAIGVLRESIQSHLERLDQLDVTGKLVDTEKKPVKRERDDADEIQTFKCDKCNLCYDTSMGLKIHVLRCTGEERKNGPIHTCIICAATFSSKELFLAHANRHEGKKPFVCRLGCDASFFGVQQRRTHEYMSHTEQVACPKCDAVLSNKHSFHLHLKQVHEHAKQQCETCGKTFGRRREMLKHQKKWHTKPAEAAEPETKKNHEVKQEIVEEPISQISVGAVKIEPESPVGDELQDGREDITIKKEPLDEIDAGREHTEQNFQAIDTIKTEPDRIEGEDTKESPAKRQLKDVKVFTCTGCSISFDSDGALHTHSRHCKGPGAIDRDALFCCHYCSALFSEKKFISAHINRHVGNKPFICRHRCTKSFFSSGSRYRHESVCRGGEHVCHLCSSKLADKFALKQHMQRTHGVARLACKTCGKMFRRSYTLTQHEKFVHGETKYPCDVCGKLFKEPRTVQKHVQLMHMGEPQFRCSYCPEKFRMQKSLVRHEQRHCL